MTEVFSKEELAIIGNIICNSDAINNYSSHILQCKRRIDDYNKSAKAEEDKIVEYQKHADTYHKKQKESRKLLTKCLVKTKKLEDKEEKSADALDALESRSDRTQDVSF